MSTSLFSGFITEVSSNDGSNASNKAASVRFNLHFAYLVWWLFLHWWLNFVEGGVFAHIFQWFQLVAKKKEVVNTGSWQIFCLGLLCNQVDLWTCVHAAVRRPVMPCILVATFATTNLVRTWTRRSIYYCLKPADPLQHRITSHRFEPVAVAWLMHELGGESILVAPAWSKETWMMRRPLNVILFFSIPMSVVLKRMFTNEDSYEANQMRQAGQKVQPRKKRVSFCCSPGNVIATRWQTNLFVSHGVL